MRHSEDTAQQLLPWARLLNADFVWIHASATVLEATLAHSLNMIGTPTLAVEMGVGMRITRQYTEQLVTGIFRVMQEMGIWDGPTEPVRTPVISTDGEVELVNASCSGIFMPCAAFGTQVKKGTLLGEIVRPLTGQVLERVLSPIDGLLFTRREYPVVYEGALLARVLGGREEMKKKLIYSMKSPYREELKVWGYHFRKRGTFRVYRGLHAGQRDPADVCVFAAHPAAA